MENEIAPLTLPGRKMVEAAEYLARSFEGSAATNDREGRFPAENIEAMAACGYLYAPLPVACGGWGVDSVHDVLVASSRMARGDAGITLGMNMHLIAMLTYVRQWNIARSREDGRRMAAIEQTMAELVHTRSIIAAAVSEPDQRLLLQSTTATPTGSGWVVNGRKIICSMAPAATHFSTAVNYKDDNGVDRYAFTVIDRNAPGVTVHDDWDALGMRSSGSVTVTFKDVPLNGKGPGRGVLAGTITAEYLENSFTSGPAHAAGSLGVAEAAFQAGVESVQGKRARMGDDAMRSTFTCLAAESAIELSAARAIFSRALQTIDEHYARFPAGYGDLESAHRVFGEAQRAKAFVNRTAISIVDRAMTMSGGAAYMNKHPLARYWRDVRAGGFMHPLGEHVAYDYLGGLALGTPPENL